MKNSFRFPMQRSERVIGAIYIPVHVFLLPWLIAYVYSDLLGRGHAELKSPDMSLAYYVVSFVFVLVFLFRYLKTSFSDFIDRLADSLKAVVLGYLLNYAAGFVVSLLLTAVLKDAVNPNMQELISQTKLNAGTIAVVSVLLAPIVEETLFRGVLFGGLRGKSRAVAYAASAAAFAFYHLWQFFVGGFEWRMLLYLLQYVPPSLILCWCYEQGGSVWAPIALHAIINFVTIRVILG